jgi:hypothetical protein
MRTILTGVLSLMIFVSCNNAKQESKPAGNGVSKHSNSFNNSVQSAMISYLGLTEAFVNWDSVAVDKKAGELKLKLDSINFYGFSPQTITAPVDTLNLAKKDIQSMIENKAIVDKRHYLDSLTGHLYAFLDKVQYDEKKIYYNECPMAFNDSIPAHWLNVTDDIRNPYLGLHHPKYGKAMIECGSTISTIDFTSKK